MIAGSMEETRDESALQTFTVNLGIFEWLCHVPVTNGARPFSGSGHASQPQGPAGGADGMPIHLYHT